jgi:hypothetical protein
MNDQEPKAMEGLIEGRMVHYMMPSNGEHRPAVIVKVWDHGEGIVNLQVFTDCGNDFREVSGGGSTDFNDAVATGILWRTSIPYDKTMSLNTWHWIERA